MQSLLLKLMVLGSVVGGSCFVAYKVHTDLQPTSAENSSEEFTPLDSDAEAELFANERDSDALTSPLTLRPSLDDPAPLLAASGIPNTRSNARTAEVRPVPDFDFSAEPPPRTAIPREFPLLLTANENSATAPEETVQTAPQQGEPELPLTSLPPQQAKEPEYLPLDEEDPFRAVPIPAATTDTTSTNDGQDGSDGLVLPQPQPLSPATEQTESLLEPVADPSGEQTPHHDHGELKPPPGLLMFTPRKNWQEETAPTEPAEPNLLLPEPSTSQTETQPTAPEQAHVENRDQITIAGGETAEAGAILPTGGEVLPGKAAFSLDLRPEETPARNEPLPTTAEDPSQAMPIIIPQQIRKTAAAVPTDDADEILPTPSNRPGSVTVTPREQLAADSDPFGQPPTFNTPPAAREIPEFSSEPAAATLAPENEVLPTLAAPPNEPASGTTGNSGSPLGFDAAPEEPRRLPENNWDREVTPTPATNPLPERDDPFQPAPGSLPLTPQPEPQPSTSVPVHDNPFERRATPAEPEEITPVQAESPVPTLPTTPALTDTLNAQPATTDQLIGRAELDLSAPSGPQTPELKIEKIAPEEAVIGEPLIYAIIVRNVGGSAAHNVVVEDRIPRGTQLEGTIPQAYLNEGVLTWNLGTLKPGEEHKVQLKVIPLEPGQIGSVATVSFASSVSAAIQVNAPDLTISMEGPSEAIIGQKVGYRFLIQNQGKGAAKSVILRTILPPTLKHPGGNDLEYEVGQLGAGEQKVIDLTVIPEGNGIVTPRAMVSNDSKVYAETRADLRVIAARLLLSRTGPAGRFVGRPGTYVTTVQNESSSPMQQVTVQETVPEGVELAALPDGGRWDPVRRTITWSIPSLNAQESRELRCQLVAKVAGEHQGQILAQDLAGSRAEIKSLLDVKGFADLDIDVAMASGAARTVEVGEQVSLRVTLKNDGTASARRVRTQFQVPPGMTFQAARGPVEFEQRGNLIEFAALDEIPINDQRTFDIVLTAAQAGESKVTVQLQSADYSEPLTSEAMIRVLQETR